ncbi:MAG TPA: prephenate dehydrogenase/arogenate dehydrogenase family protein, partial [Acidimicrobiia bacterium]|nr:prephenate dehydrogenase/arogenate dehydrogenase family protein [Acidimicrobiia bacterium]
MNPGSAIVFGTGLLGSSVGLALRSQGWSVIGWDPDPEALNGALERGAVTTTRDGPDPADCDLVVLASPPSAVISTLGGLETDRLVTDIAGVKGPVVAAASHLPHFVGGHPMAGGETSGPSLATSTLFHGATWILTSDGADPADLAGLEDLVTSFGANPKVMSAADHDAAVARVSHLPHILAAALMSLAESDPAALGLAGTGFRDLTRIAAADGGWWAEVLRANSEQVGTSIDELRASLDVWKEAVTANDALGELLDAARRARAGLGEHHTQVRVVLLDQPGEIARVGHALETSRVDVRDFQLRHGE